MNIEGLVHAWHHASARKTDPVEVAKLPFLLESLKTADADAFAEWLVGGDDLETCFLGLQDQNPTGMTALLHDAGVTVFRLVCSTSWYGDTTLTVTGTPNGDIPLVAATCEQTPSHFDHEDGRLRVLVDPAAYVSFERVFQAADFWSMPESLAFGNDVCLAYIVGVEVMFLSCNPDFLVDAREPCAESTCAVDVIQVEALGDFLCF